MADAFPTYTHFSNYPAAYLHDSLDLYQPHPSRLVQHHQMPRATESKPRLSKEEVELLEAEFQKNHKPSSTTKKALAESMRVDNARINNWFQNRRAREKKENNIREYEAKQRLEKERSEASEGSQPDNMRQRDLVASSAPFPQPGVSTKPESEAALSPCPSGEANEHSQSDESDLLSPLSLPMTQEISIDGQARLNGLLVKTEQEDDDNCALSDQMDEYLAMQDRSMLAVASKAAEQQFLAGFGDQDDVDRRGQDGDSSPFSDDSEPRSPEGADIASRRNRRPAPLSIAGGRSHSYSSRACDFSRAGDGAVSMRRISSSTGSGRVKKSAATPRSPFFDRGADILFQRRHSPNGIARQGSAAPPTPDTPVALQQHGSVDAAMPSLYSLEGKYTPPDVVMSDPTLRTPPTTPGFGDSLFHLGAGYELGISEETIVAPGIDRANRGLEMASNPAAFASYILNNNAQCTGQHQVASLFPTQLGQPCFGFMGTSGNSEYNWSDLSPSATSTCSNSRQRFTALGHVQN
ncbi:Homeodomain-like protein [Metarhizium album ARSEF 1941]|uniref:Homeodomain-like protein n=1 Tax=Metarhizium album (strain ARSEF 1941) TaxID=1081103 RepID=A0A0B2WK27_METAS|nr:Homeodomain-like protein [Metarhizium album ARSEF 1941]KHN96411.1 Homeodomain-like protein [Metarhizium album ARSEF 1941]